jgi:hypothetical protein
MMALVLTLVAFFFFFFCRCVRLPKLSWLFRVEQKRLRRWVCHSPGSSVCVSAQSCAGEQGKVEESMKEMAAIEALKSEKSEKEVCYWLPCLSIFSSSLFKWFPSAISSNSQIHLAHLATKNCACAMCVAPICPCWTLTVDWRTTSEAR